MMIRFLCYHNNNKKIRTKATQGDKKECKIFTKPNKINKIIFIKIGPQIGFDDIKSYSFSNNGLPLFIYNVQSNIKRFEKNKT